MKCMILLCALVCTAPTYSKKPHTHHHHHNAAQKPPEQKPDPQVILSNIFGIILNGIAIAQGNAQPNGQNHAAIAQHAGNIIHEFNKAYPGKNLTREEIIEELKKLKIPETITKKALLERM